MSRDLISPHWAGNLFGLFRTRVTRSPEQPAYRYYVPEAGWLSLTWQQVADQVSRWQQAMASEGLMPGDRVAVMVRNRPEWVFWEQAALGLGLVVVPLYVNDRAENAAYCLDHAGTRCLLLEDESQWRALERCWEQLQGLERVVTLEAEALPQDPRLVTAADWLPAAPGPLQDCSSATADELATIVYTSGTTGRPKGVMLSHHNILDNARACLDCVAIGQEDLFLSFLPLSHTLERTVGHYLPMMAGATVAYARGIPQLAEDLATIQPTVLISVPRIFERIQRQVAARLAGRRWLQWLYKLGVAAGYHRFRREQGRAGWHPRELWEPLTDRLFGRPLRARLGGCLRLTICGGAPLGKTVAQELLGLGVPLIQGYGLTETSPVVTTNRLEDNQPFTVGKPLPGVEIALGEDDEIMVRGPNVALGYWRDEAATARLIRPDGWLHTGDKGDLESGYLLITGRLKEIIVLANGEKVPPGDMETAIARDPLVEQVMVTGEGRPYLTALVVLNPEAWRKVVGQPDLDEAATERLLLEHIAYQLQAFPGYAQVYRAKVLWSPWTVEDGMLTPTLKLRRERILARHEEDLANLYAGH